VPERRFILNLNLIIMKKLLLGLMTVSFVSFLTYSCTKDETSAEKTTANSTLKSSSVDPTDGLNLTFHPNGISGIGESDIETVAGVDLWERGVYDNMGSRGRRKYNGHCQFWGLCGSVSQRINFNDNNYTLIGRNNVKCVITKENVNNGYIYLYQSQSISHLDSEFKSFDVHFDVPIEGTNLKMNAGIYMLDESIGQYGAYKILISKN
jgi:hypothetical protein